ncbi:MAG: NUDIX hydrolase [Clostridia bacterium]|nr:NUDIX hydrolase [Clostridia bacterium]
MNIIDALKKYVPVNIREEKDREMMLRFLENEKDCLLRENLAGHITVSPWVVNKDRTKTLFCYHNIYNSWSWLGGHADGESDLISVAFREAKEETGISPELLSEEIFSIEILPVLGHMKKGEYVPSHIHYNFTFLFEADEHEDTAVNPEENSAVKWIALDDIEKMSTEPWMVENIYKKLIEKTK